MEQTEAFLTAIVRWVQCSGKAQSLMSDPDWKAAGVTAREFSDWYIQHQTRQNAIGREIKRKRDEVMSSIRNKITSEEWDMMSIHWRTNSSLHNLR